VNPTSVASLKMVGRWEEEEAAERLRKPKSGNVASKMEIASGNWETRKLVDEPTRR